MYKLLNTLTIFILFLSINAKSEVLNIRVNSPRELDSQSLYQIFYIRKNMINQYPILKTANKNPSTSLAFRQIVPFKKWWGVKGMLCYASGNLSTEGMSEESRFIDNPFALIAIEEGNALHLMNKQSNCPTSYIKLKRLNFNTKTNTFNAVFNVSDHLNTIKKIAPHYPHELSLSFNGLNAVDFKFFYAHAIDLKNILFKKQPNISSDIYMLKNFIHLGNSCGYRGGCNNGSPYQPALIFKISKFPASATFHLWQTNPSSTSASPDIIYKIVIE